MNLPISDDASPDDLVPATGAARLAHCHLATLYRWIAAGKLRAWQRGGKGGRVFVSRSEVQGLLRPVTVRGKPVAKKPRPVTREAQKRRAAAELDALGI